ncbi:MAG TPA: histidine kinase [Bacillus bacterium]|nr:histidine kinase [Bacillus sp. (in: firmicutes)]
MWHEYKMTNEIKPFPAFWLFILAIFLSQFLSVQFNSEVRYDLRGIPLLIGGLYLGNPYAYLLYMGMLIIRAIHGVDLGFLISAGVYGVQFILMSILVRRFEQATINMKMVFSLSLSIITSLFFVVVMFLLNLSMSIFDWSVYIFLFALGSVMVTVAIETWKNHLRIRVQMLKSEKMEAVSQLAASISHEVRNPLTTVKGFLQLLNDSDLDPKSKEFITISIDEVNRANNIIHDYLSFAKPSIDKIETIDVEAELIKAVNITRPLALMNVIECDISLKPSINIRGDIHQFHQCLVNLMKNSIEAMPQGGCLSVVSSLQDDKVLICISDTGVGMTEEQVMKLGEPYYSTKGPKGTGLGLMVSFAIIRAMKGTVKVESEVGKGSTFILSFPLNHKT